MTAFPLIHLSESSKFSLCSYADDMLLYITISSAADYVKLQEDIDQIYRWFATNLMHVSKCKCMLISWKWNASMQSTHASQQLDPLDIATAALEHTGNHRGREWGYSIDHNTLLMLSKEAAQPGHNQRMQIKLFQLFHKSSVGNSIKDSKAFRKSNNIYTAYFIILVKLG